MQRAPTPDDHLEAPSVQLAQHSTRWAAEPVALGQQGLQV